MNRFYAFPLIIIGLLLSLNCSNLHLPPDVLVVKTVSSNYDPNKELSHVFEDQRSFVISFNNKVIDADKARMNLFSDLRKKNLLNQVVFNFFISDRQPDFVEIKFGHKVPTAIIQSVIHSFIDIPNIKMTFSQMEKDGFLGDTQKVYVASLIQVSKKPIAIEYLRLATNPQISRSEFLSILLDNR